MIEYLSLNKLESFVKEPIEIINSNISSDVLTVILITYNHNDTIEESIAAIINQKTNFKFELIICDDESIDGTTDVCKAYAYRYPKLIKVFLHKRTNNIKVLNKHCGIFQITYSLLSSSGKYIAICSGDDVWTDPLKLQKQFDFLEANPNFSLSFHSYEVENKVFKNSFPKASTMFFINVNKELPLNFLNVIQEDVFLWFILRNRGRFFYDNYVLPTKIGVSHTSVTGSMKRVNFIDHIFNVNLQIYESYKDLNDSKSHQSLYRLLIFFWENKFEYQALKNFPLTLKRIRIKSFIKMIGWRLSTSSKSFNYN